MLLTTAILLLMLGGAAALSTGPRERLTAILGSGSAVLALLAYGGHIGQCFDRQTLFFQLPVILTGIAAAAFAPAYLKGSGSRRGGWFWCFFNLTLAAMIAVIEIKEELLAFLVAWEMMGLCSFALVAFERGEDTVRRASWSYLAACEAGGLALMLAAAGDLMAMPQELHTALYPYLLLIGFGLKAGFPLLHTWLPEAHPAAPAPVSAVMSGAMIPLAFCGFMRFLPEEFDLVRFGWILLILGAAGAFGGILCGMAQNNLKRLLAYSSVENIGIMTLGFGLSFLAEAVNAETAMYCAWAGAMLHVVNHALLKGGLFLGAGAVLKCTGTLNVDSLGGLDKRMPHTARLFTLNSLGICGLPPFAGFTGELLIYAAALAGLLHGGGKLPLAGLVVILTLALTGAAAGMAFAKASGGVFSGEPRSEAARQALPECRTFVWPVLGLVILSLLVPLAAPFGALLLTGSSEAAGKVVQVLGGYAFFTLLVYSFTFLLRYLRRAAAGGAKIRRSGTWDCGYARPTARMEYTGSAFVQPLADLFNGLLQQEKKIRQPQGYFPDQAALEVTTGDPAVRRVWRPLGTLLERLADQVHRVQSGYLHLYVLLMIAALAAMLIWSSFYGEGR